MSLHTNGSFDILGSPRPELYGIREHGWYEKSWKAKSGDISFSRETYSNILGITYEDYWVKATGSYISQSSHPVWFSARVNDGILPGYRNTDIIRRVDKNIGINNLGQFF
ncbi:MAG: hypothetical protein HQK79_22125 [Desulfobacterales bacterium]|nr:hypothetical protein [Desulfobacterales bacterium]